VSTRVAIIADDLTGCNDSVAPFAVEGVVTQAFVHLRIAIDASAQVIGINTNTRCCNNPWQAKVKVLKAIAFAEGANCTYLYKKIDSTGKGNVGTEIEATLSKTGRSVALVCPAVPEQGRTMEGGKLLLQSQLVEPIDFSEIISSQTNIHVDCISLNRLEQICSDHSTSNLYAKKKKQIWLVDATEQAHLDRIAYLCHELKELAIPVGSSGLSRALVPHWIATSEKRQLNISATSSAGPVMFIIGSTNPVTWNQLHFLQKYYDVTPLDMAEEFESSKMAPSHRVFTVINDWRLNRSAELKQLLASCRCFFPATIVLSGGDTAQFVCDVANTRTIQINGEITPGIPWGIALDGCLKNCTIVTKAGGFGAPDFFAQVCKSRLA